MRVQLSLKTQGSHVYRLFCFKKIYTRSLDFNIYPKSMLIIYFIEKLFLGNRVPYTLLYEPKGAKTSYEPTSESNILTLSRRLVASLVKNRLILPGDEFIWVGLSCLKPSRFCYPSSASFVFPNKTKSLKYSSFASIWKSCYRVELFHRWQRSADCQG